MQSSLSAGGGAPRARVLHCIPTLASGGAETQLRRLAARLCAKGVATAVFGRMDAAVERELTDAGVRCFVLADGRHYDPRQLVALRRAVRQFRPTVIQTWLTQMDILGGMVALATGTPWLIAERTSPACYPPSWRNRIRVWLGSRADGIVANSMHGLEVWPNHPRRSVIGNGIDLRTIAAAPAGALRASPAFQGQPVVLSVSRLVPEKQVDVLIRMIAAARTRWPAIRLVVVGDGPERTALEALAGSLDVARQVTFVGNQTDPIPWFRSADLFASASLFEGHPNAVLEAAAAGLPMVLSDIPMHRSFVGDAAVYAPLNDHAGMAEAVAAVVTAPSPDRFAMPTAALARYDLDFAADRYVELYREVTDTAGRPRRSTARTA